VPTTHNPAPADRLIVALDVPSRTAALDLVDSLSGLVSYYKIGYQLFLAEGMPLVRTLIGRGNRIFLDLKLDDVDETVTLAVREIAKNGVHLLTLQGSAATVRAAVAGRGTSEHPKLLFVTLLSSMNEQDLADLQLVGPSARFATQADYIQWRAQYALAAGADGLIASGASVADLRRTFGDTPLIVTPGIRPASAPTNEHKRPATPGDAIAAGADYLVVGRLIRDAADRRAMAAQIIGEIERPSIPHAASPTRP
jgi:orotidine-5'-phosphate decarboxylase